MDGTRTFFVPSSICGSASEDNLGKRISPVASQKIILLVSTIAFQFLPLGHLLNHDHQMVWFNWHIPFDDAKNKTKPLITDFDVPFQEFYELFFGPLYFCIGLDTLCLLCSLVFLRCLLPPEHLVVYFWTFGLFDSSRPKKWPLPSNNEIFIDPRIIKC